MPTREPTPVLGWKEQASLPRWGIRRLRVKLDTGARSSAVHVRDLTVVGHHVLDGRELPILRFAVMLGRDRDARRRIVTAPAVGFRRVRDTGARAERRPVVRTRVVCGPLDRMTDITVTDRTGMNFRMILGRSTLEGYLVDPGHGYRSTPAPPRRSAVESQRRTPPRAVVPPPRRPAGDHPTVPDRKRRR
ncbi:MAG: RimK/LysX family protein [Actinomycetota bacterium]|nr:RimK/LysX family protein [Actinomycetota bacterium]